MEIDFSALGPLAEAVEKAGAPILAAALRAGSSVSAAAPFPLNLVLPAVLNGVADAVGGSSDDLPALAGKVASDPNAATKIQAIEDTHKDDLQNALDFARLQVEQNAVELGVAAPLWAKVLFAGWRPAMGWIGGPVLVSYQLAAATYGLKPVPADIFNWTVTAWGMLAGLRTVDKWQGAASPASVVPAPIRKITKRAAGK